MRSYGFVAACLLCWMIESQTIAEELEISDQQTILVDAVEELHFPFMHQAEDGTWYLTYREGKHAVSGGDRVKYAFSQNRGKSWQPWTGLPLDRAELKPPKESGDSRVRLFRTRLADGTLLSHRYIMENVQPNSAGQGFDWDGYLLSSADDGANWKLNTAKVADTPFSKLAGFWGHILESKEGKLLAGVYGSAGAKPQFFNGIVQSEDGGKTWTFLNTIGKGLGTEGPNELDLAKLASGELLSVFRTGSQASREPSNELYYSLSKDEGKTWSTPRPLPDTQASVSPQLMRLGGRVVLVYGQARKQIFGRVSQDGIHWTAPVLLFSGGGSGYVDLQLLTDDTLQMVFEESAFIGKPIGRGSPPKPNRLLRAELRLREPKTNSP